jgi:5-methylcytosine-specific restriction endonuclease McrA
MRREFFMSKKCKVCEEVKNESEFYKVPSNKDGLTSLCRACISKANKAKHEADPEKYRQRVREYKRKNPDKVKQSREKYRELEVQRKRDKRREARAGREIKKMGRPYAHGRKLTWSEKYQRRLQRDPDLRTKNNEQVKKWRRDNLAQVSFYSHRSRVIKKQAPGKFSFDEWKRLCDEFGNKCLACGKEELTVDHIVPLIKGGTNYIHNIQPLCKSCNSSKNTKTIDYRPFIPEWVTI